MTLETDADLTLPSVVASLPGQYDRQALVLTIIFHPDTSRIGEQAVLFDGDVARDQDPRVLGRLGPDFGRGDRQTLSPLEDRHVSRRALEFSWSGAELLIERPAGASRCRLLGRELLDPERADAAALQAGVSLMLGHSTLLLLRQSRVGGAQVEDDLGLWGSSAYMSSLRQQIIRAGHGDDDVLIRGETGSGKELVARAIHAVSNRADGPLVTVNTAAIPADLAAAELFGSVRGAFTGADRNSPGYFRQAQGGSLFLDEVGDMPAEIQPQLLRALQQREIQSVGGTIHRIDLRVISATDAPLEGEGSDFKAALLHRLGTHVIDLLPLREHPEDIGELALHMFRACAALHEDSALLPDENSSEIEIAGWAELFHRLLLYTWPGNVRELANVCRQVAAASLDGLTVPDHVRESLAKTPALQPASAASKPLRKMRDVRMAEFDQAWQDSGFEPQGTARRLHVSRQSVYRRIGESPQYRLASDVNEQELQRALRDCGGDSALAATELRVSLVSLRARLRGTDLDWY